MTPKEYRAFTAVLKKVDINDVQESANPALEPDAIKRDIAITELERRELALESQIIKGSIFVQPLFWIIVITSMVGIAIWAFY